MTEKDNRGAIWGNDRKEKDTQPDFKGQAMIDGTEYWVSAWKRKPDANPKAPSLNFAFEPKNENRGDSVSNNVGSEKDDFDDPLPF